MFNPLEQFNVLPGFPMDSSLFGSGLISIFFSDYVLESLYKFYAALVKFPCLSVRTFFISALYTMCLYEKVAESMVFLCPSRYFSIFWWFSAILCYLLVFSLYTFGRIQKLCYGSWTFVVHGQFNYVESLVDDNVGLQHAKYFVYVWLIFISILLFNIFGLVPYFFTLTSHIIVTFALSLVFFVGFNVLAVRLHGLKFFTLFVPSGAPAFIRPFLVYIEMISYFARVFSLSIRLFANMTAGHTLLKILAGYVYVLFVLPGTWPVSGLVSFLIVVVVTVLEVFIAFLQSYVFSMLLCVYLNDVLNVGEH